MAPTSIIEEGPVERLTAERLTADQPLNTRPSRSALVRVLHLINGEHYSGAERVQDLLALRLPTEGFEVGFACLKPGRFPAMRESTSELHEVGMGGKFDWTVIRRIASVVRENNYAVLHAHTPRTALVGRAVAGLTGRPLIYHVHSPTSRDSTQPLRNVVNQLVERVCVRGATRLITVSRSLEQHMRGQGVLASRLSVVPNGVPCAKRTRSTAPPTGTWTLGSVALFRPRKGIEVLIDALAELRRNGYDVRLRAVGPFETPDYARSVKERVLRHDLDDFVDWVGFTKDVEPELRQMDLFVLPSLFGEGLPMVVLEAMATGVPIVSTQVEGIPEAIRDGVDGLLALPNDAPDLARCIAKIVTNDVSWTALSANALRRHCEQFSDQVMAAGVAKVYREVLK